MRAFSNTTIMFHIRIDRCYRYLKNKRYVLLTIHIHIKIDKNTDRLLDGQIDRYSGFFRTFFMSIL